ncbi:MAG: Hsp70 family protein [bacterium]
MRIGIDYGTSNTVVSYMDNHTPVVMKFNHAGLTKDVFPSVSFYPEGASEGCHGLEALECAFAGQGTLVRSLKRNLKNYFQGLQLCEETFQRDVKGILVDFLKHLKKTIIQTQHLTDEEELEVLLTVPANANGAQRLITRECFREAGFVVSPRIIDEPTASAIEFSYTGMSERLRGQANQGNSIYVLVYDLGGGTFDVSLVRIEPERYSVIASAGIEQLGGDDFDQCLYQMVIENKELSGLTPLQEKLLLYRCCEAKESLANIIDPKYLRIDLEEAHIDEGSIRLRVEDYYERLLPLVNQTLSKLEEVLHSKMTQGEGITGLDQVEKIYLVGGGSQLPLILKRVQEKYGREKVHLSSLPFASIALGACHMVQQKMQVEQILSRTFGVIRTAGGREYFDPIFEQGTRIPATKRFEIYPEHNIGYYRYLECAEHRDGQAVSPRMWSEIFFPYDPDWNLSRIPGKGDIQVKRYGVNKVIEEFSCDENGIITVNLIRETDSVSMRYEIWEL